MKRLTGAILFWLLLYSQVYAAQIVVLGPSNQVIAYKEFTANSTDTVFTALKKLGIQYTDEGEKYPQFDGCYITSIGGYSIQQTNGWIYTVNDMQTKVSASNQSITNSDRIVWCAYDNVENIQSYNWPEVNSGAEFTENNISEAKETEASIDIDLERYVEESIEYTEETQAKESTELIVEEIEAEEQELEENIEPIYDIKLIGEIGIVIAVSLTITLISISRGEKDE